MRKSNEDAFGLFAAGGSYLGHQGRLDSGAPLIAVVSDGVGGHDAGEVASAATVAAIGAGLGQLKKPDSEASLAASMESIKTLLHGLNGHLRKLATGQGQEKQMAATVTAAWLVGGKLIYAHAGDSRLYRWRSGQLQCLTTDDTVAGRAVASGKMTDEEARKLKNRHVLQRAIGIENESFGISSDCFDVEDGEVYMLCSDGLTDGLDDSQLSRGFERLDVGDLSTFAHRMVEAANRASGKDNVTVVLVAVEQGWCHASRQTSTTPSNHSSIPMNPSKFPQISSIWMLVAALPLILVPAWWLLLAEPKFEKFIDSELDRTQASMDSHFAELNAQLIKLRDQGAEHSGMLKAQQSALTGHAQQFVDLNDRLSPLLDLPERLNEIRGQVDSLKNEQFESNRLVSDDIANLRQEVEAIRDSVEPGTPDSIEPIPDASLGEGADMDPLVGDVSDENGGTKTYEESGTGANDGSPADEQTIPDDEDVLPSTVEKVEQPEN